MPLPPHPALISNTERLVRIQNLREKMEQDKIAGVLLGSTESLRYFTGLAWSASERLLGALITPQALTYIVPAFERSRVETLPHLAGEIATWEEDESPTGLVKSHVGSSGRIVVDGALPLFVFRALVQSLGAERLGPGPDPISELRLCKSPSEIALIQYAMELTLEVQKRAHAIMKPGIRASEIRHFIDDQHKALGAVQGSSFCIVSFGSATSLPHGADDDQVLEKGQPILVDTGTRIDGYHSDLTRTYMLDEPDAEFARLWAMEHEAQQAVFQSAQIGVPCSRLDDAARAVIECHGLGPDYRLPGLPHRSGHGIGLEIHEEPYIVRGNSMALRAGMCFSNEPMLVLPNRFGVRLEDHIYLTDSGPQWFTKQAKGPTEPFA